MSDTQNNKSEVARILNQIRAEYEAAQRGLSGLADGTGKHAFITAQMENMGKLHVELGDLIGEMPAITLIVEHLESIPVHRLIKPRL